MKIRWVHIPHFTVCVFGLLIISISASAGSFQDINLEEDLSGVAQPSAQIPFNSKSETCMQCHDGSIAINVSIKHADTAMRFTNHGSSNHPVGMNYANYVRKDPTSYIASARLDTRVELENGQVTCVSCHKTNLHNSKVAEINEPQLPLEKCTSTKALTTGPGRTRLCLSCHVI